MERLERLENAVAHLKGKKIIKSQQDIASALGVNKTTVSLALKGDKRYLTDSFLTKFCNAFNVFNRNWLIAGEGDMLQSAFTPGSRTIDIGNFMSVPLVPIRANAGYLTGFGDIEFIESLPVVPVIVDKNYKGKYRCFEVFGDSMDDGSRGAICDKDIILAREIKRELWKSKLHIRDWNFVIVHRHEGITVKQITHHDVETGTIRCHPANSLYDDFTLNLNDVLELYNVIKIVDRSVRL